MGNFTPLSVFSVSGRTPGPLLSDSGRTPGPPFSVSGRTPGPLFFGQRAYARSQKVRGRDNLDFFVVKKQHLLCLKFLFPSPNSNQWIRVDKTNFIQQVEMADHTT